MSATPSRPRLVPIRPEDLETGGTLRLSFDITDDEVVGEVRRRKEGHERDEYVRNALKVGVIAMRHAGTQIDAEAIRREGRLLVERLTEQVKAHRDEVEKVVGSTLDGYFNPESGKLSERLSRLVKGDGEIASILNEHLTGENSRLSTTIARQVGKESDFLKRLDPDSQSGVIRQIEMAVDNLLNKQKEEVLGQFDLNKPDSAINRLVSNVKKLNESVTGEFDMNSETSALSRLRDLLKATQDHIGKQLTLDDDQSPLARMNRAMADQLKEIMERQATFQEEVSKTLAEISAKRKERMRSAAHGLDFEDELHEALNIICPQDQVEAVGDTIGLVPSSKVGDFVITLGAESAAPGTVIVLEAKQAVGEYRNKSKALAELEVACKNRNGEIGVFVYSQRSVQTMDENGTRHDWKKLIERHGNDVLVVWDPEDENSMSILEAALSVARALAVREALAIGDEEAQGEEEDLLDWNTLDTAINELEKQIERFDNIRKFCDNIERDAGKIRDESDKMAKKIKLSGERISSELERLR